MADPLPTLVNAHTWSTIKDEPSRKRRLVPVGTELIDSVEETGEFNIWNVDYGMGASGDPLPAPARTSGTWASIRAGHELVFLADSPANPHEGNVLDWVPATKAVEIWRFDRAITSGNPMPVRLNQSSFTTIGTGHRLIYLDYDRVLDWEPTTGRARVWQYDRTRVGLDPLPTLVTDFTWATIRSGHQLVYVGGDLVLDWEESTGNVRVWRYDRNAAGTADPLPTKEMEDDWSTKIAAGRRLFYLGSDLVLDWDPATGQERVWDFDRPMAPATAFSAMLASDLVTAGAWVAAAQAALAAYQIGVLTGVHDVTWLATDAALNTHFHVNGLSSTVSADVSTIMTTYGNILGQLTAGVAAATIRAVSKAQAVTALGGRQNYTRAFTAVGTQTSLPPAFRPLDVMGRFSLDGAGPKMRAAILIHETAHFVGLGTDFATEWQPAYATLTSTQAIANPASYATFAHHVSPGGSDLRFGHWQWL